MIRVLEFWPSLTWGEGKLQGLGVGVGRDWDQSCFHNETPIKTLTSKLIGASQLVNSLKCLEGDTLCHTAWGEGTEAGFFPRLPHLALLELHPFKYNCNQKYSISLSSMSHSTELSNLKESWNPQVCSQLGRSLGGLETPQNLWLESDGRAVLWRALLWTWESTPTLDSQCQNWVG